MGQLCCFSSVAILLFLSLGNVMREAKAVASEESNPSTVNDLLNQGVVYVYTMTNFFLDDIVQRSYLTKITNVVDLTSVTTLTDSLTSQWSNWIIYLMGFVVCGAMGVVLAVVMLLACLFFPCCRCCGRCGAPKSTPNQSGMSKGCTFGCSLALVIVAFGLAFGAVGMYAANEEFHIQVAGNMFDSINNAIDGVSSFFNLTIKEINEKTYGKFLATEDTIFAIIEDVPSDAIQAIDNATGAVTTLNKLSDFGHQLGTLQTQLLDSQSLAESLDSDATQLTSDLSVIVAEILLALSNCTSSDCNQAAGETNATRVRVDFSVVNVSTALAAVNLSLSMGLVDLIDQSSQQLTSIEDSINSTIWPQINDMKSTAKTAEEKLSGIVSSLQDTLNSIDFASFKQQILDISELKEYTMAVDIARWFLLALACIVVGVVFFDLLGLLMGCCLPPSRNSSSGCGCSKTVGYHLLLTATGLTLIFYWIFSLLVLVLFLLGGTIHTEVCRHIVHNDQSASSEVLSIFDGWIDEALDIEDLSVRPFNLYSECQKNVSLFQAFDLGSKYNLTSTVESSTSSIKEATELFKSTVINIPKLNLSDPTLIAALNTLDNGLSESNLNFTNFYLNTEGNITDPPLLVLADDLDAVLSVNLSSFAASLRSLHNNSVIPMSKTRDKLVSALKTCDSIIHLVSFGEAADTLVRSDDVINTNGSYIVSSFKNATADTVYATVEDFATGVVSSLENDLARCGMLYLSLKTAFDVVCVQFLYPLNGYWFSLGWCMFFLIPNIFLSVKLASAFRIGTSKNSIKHKDS